MDANVLDVVVKALTVATNFMMFCSTGSVNCMAFMVGASGFECAARVGKIYTESIGARVNCDLDILPLPPQSTRKGFLLLSSMAHRQHMILGHPAIPQEFLLVPLSIPPEAAVEPVHPKLFQSSTFPSDSPPLDVRWMIRATVG